MSGILFLSKVVALQTLLENELQHWRFQCNFPKFRKLFDVCASVAINLYIYWNTKYKDRLRGRLQILFLI